MRVLTRQRKQCPARDKAVTPRDIIDIRQIHTGLTAKACLKAPLPIGAAPIDQRGEAASRLRAPRYS
jgi:hypothetical protein